MHTYTIYNADGLICGQFINRSRAVRFMRVLHRGGCGKLKLVRKAIEG